MTDIISGILSVLLVAILISTIFFYVFNTKGPWGSFWTFFLIILLCVWISQIWIQPFGPLYFGIAWLTLATAGLLAALLLAAIPSQHSHQKRSIIPPKQKDPDPAGNSSYESFSRKTATISGIFWIFMVILLLVIVLGYVF